MQQQIQYLPYKLGIVCPHTQEKANANYIDIACSLHQQIYHRVSQASKICNKCATLIMQSTNSVDYCPCCIEKLEQLIADSWICSHRERNLEQIIIKCLSNQKQTHQIPFKHKVCKMCYDKIRAAFMFANSCVVCDQKQNELFENMEKTITKPSFYYFNEIIRLMVEKKYKQGQIKAEIQNYCLAQPKKKCDSKFKNQANKFGQNLEQYHISKRYQLYPKCIKHRNNFIDLCNNCLVSILNLKSCPYGCPYQKKQTKTNKIEAKTNQTGFLCLYPKASKEYQYIQYFNIRHIEQSNRLDKWECHLKKVKYLGNENILSKFGLYASAVQVNKSTFFFSGGVLGDKISQMKPTNKCFLISLLQNIKTFNIEDLADMSQARANHGVIYSNDYVYVIGGYNKLNTKCLNSCQKFNLNTKKWQKMGSLKIERSKPNVFQFKGKIYALGGISYNEQIWENQCERYNQQKNQWQIIEYKGFGVPFLTGATSISKCWGLGTTSSLMLVGGSNYQTSTYLVQQAMVNDNKFKINTSSIQQKLNYCRQSPALSLMKTQSQNQKIVVIFGGLLEHESFLSYDAIRIKISNHEIIPIFVYDDVSTGSYRLILRQNSLSAYSYMANKLLQQGLLSKQKLQGLQGEQLLRSQAKLHTIQKMWYSIGKCLIGYSGL